MIYLFFYPDRKVTIPYFTVLYHIIPYCTILYPDRKVIIPYLYHIVPYYTILYPDRKVVVWFDGSILEAALGTHHGDGRSVVVAAMVAAVCAAGSLAAS